MHYKNNSHYISLYLILLVFAITGPSCRTHKSAIVAQVPIDRVEQMPNLPQPLKIIDWKEKALQFDSLVFNFSNTTPYGPFIWLDSAGRNFQQVTFGLYTVIGDVRQGPENYNGEFHEALTSFQSLISGGLLGIDKSNQDGFNYVKMSQNYFNRATGWNIMMNNTNPEVAMAGGGYGRDWWYDVYPNVLFYGMADIFPNVENTSMIQRSIAEKFYKADSILNGNYDYSYFDYSKMKGVNNNIPQQQDAAGGHAWVLYSAWEKFGDKKYLEGAKSATEALLDQEESRFYEILLPFGAYTAARLNAEEGTDYDVTKLLNWTFDGCQAKDGRYGWGVIAERWGDMDVYGLQGSITDGGGYGFFMNSVAMAWPLVPMVKYEPKYARTIGKFMLNVVNASRLFYPDQIDDEHQFLPAKKDIVNGIIGYEGVRKVDDYKNPALSGKSPVATGDGPKWAPGQPDVSMFSLYSTSIAGIFGAIVTPTNVDGILQLDCNITDFYADNSFPQFLYYNPYNVDKTVIFDTQKPVDLYNILTHSYLVKSANGETNITIPADGAVLMVVLPEGSKISASGSKRKVNDTNISYK